MAKSSLCVRVRNFCAPGWLRLCSIRSSLKLLHAAINESVSKPVHHRHSNPPMHCIIAMVLWCVARLAIIRKMNSACSWASNFVKSICGCIQGVAREIWQDSSVVRNHFLQKHEFGAFVRRILCAKSLDVVHHDWRTCVLANTFSSGVDIRCTNGHVLHGKVHGLSVKYQIFLNFDVYCRSEYVFLANSLQQVFKSSRNCELKHTFGP